MGVPRTEVQRIDRAVYGHRGPYELEADALAIAMLEYVGEHLSQPVQAVLESLSRDANRFL